MNLQNVPLMPSDWKATHQVPQMGGIAYGGTAGDAAGSSGNGTSAGPLAALGQASTGGSLLPLLLLGGGILFFATRKRRRR